MVAPQSAESGFGFKRPGEYEGIPPQQPQQAPGFPGQMYPQQGYPQQPQVAQMMQPAPVVPVQQPAQVQPAALESPTVATSEHTCPNCHGTLIFSLAKGFWTCPKCGTEAPNIPPPFADDELEDDEAMERTQELLGSGPSDLPAGPIPEAGEEVKTKQGEPPPEEVGGVTRDKAAESIIEIQNLIENKSKDGLYSLDAETTFESCKMAFSQDNFPAVIQLTKQIKDLVEKAEKEMKESADKPAVPDHEVMPLGGQKAQAISAMKSARELIAEAENLGFDMTESKKIYKQAEPVFRAGDFGSVINIAGDVEGSVNAVLGGKRLARAPKVAPDGTITYGKQEEEKPLISKKFFYNVLVPLGGLIVLIVGAIILFISWHDGIWNPFSDGPYDWGPYNTAGVILGSVALAIGILFAILPFILTKKIHVRMEPPKPVQMK